MRLFKSSKAVQAVNSDEETEEQAYRRRDTNRRPVDDVYEMANSFRKRFDGGDNASKDETEPSVSDEGSSSDVSVDGRSIQSESEVEENENEEKSLDTNSDDEDEWETDIAQQAAINYLQRERSIVNLQQLVYGTGTSLVSDDEGNASDNEGNDDESSDEDFFTLRDKDAKNNTPNQAGSGNKDSDCIELGESDSSRNLHVQSASHVFNMDAWLQEGENSLIERIRDRFVTGNWDDKGAGEEFDDFEDLETGEKYGPNGEVEESDDEDTAGMTDAELREYNASRKASQKNSFNDEYDEDKKGNAEKLSDDKAESEYVEALKREKEARLKRNQEVRYFE